MIVSIVVAGGRGTRMKSSLPKQFVEVDGKPVLAYTLESLEKNSLIDAIEIVYIKGWSKEIKRIIEKYNIKKAKWITCGGETVQESIRNGVYNLKNKCNNDDIVVIHDGIRPLIETDILDDVIEKCKKYGNAVSSMPYNEQIFLIDDGLSSIKYIPRETLRRVSTPQAYKYGLLNKKYREAFKKKIGIYGSSYTNTMMVELGERLFFAKGSDKNIKLTTPDDLEIFKAMLKKE